MSAHNSQEARSAAKRGIFAGALLAMIEFMGGLLSGSIAVLSSAVNTLMDFVAAIIAFFAVRESGKPPDEAHTYGHEKFESVAAAVEIILLLIVCVWVAYNAFSRLLSGVGYIEQFWIAVGTNIFSIVIDSFAYLRLKSSAKKRRNEAIEASALHFMNDLLIAFVVIVGLALYSFGVWYADSVAALGVVIFTVYSSIKAARSFLVTLLDVAPKGVVEHLREQILSVEGVKGCHHLRVRRAGSKFFVDAHVDIEGHVPLTQAHSIASRIQDQIALVFPDSDVLIHTEPHTEENPLAVIRNIASAVPEIEGIHELVVKTIGEKISVSYHIELNSQITVKSAHDIANLLENRLRKELQNVDTIISHLEPTAEVFRSTYGRPEELSKLEKQIVQVLQSFPEITSYHEVQILTRDAKYNVTLHCLVNGSMTLIQAHDIATKIEEKVRAVSKQIEEVTVHCEPEEGAFLQSNSAET